MNIDQQYENKLRALSVLNEVGLISDRAYFYKVRQLTMETKSMSDQTDLSPKTLQFTEGELITIHMALNNLTLELLPEGSLGGDEIGADLRRGYLAALKSVATKLEIYSR